MTIAGQGTIGLEILDDLPDVDVILVPDRSGRASATDREAPIIFREWLPNLRGILKT
jgi:hypothetical protein